MSRAWVLATLKPQRVVLDDQMINKKVTLLVVARVREGAANSLFLVEGSVPFFLNFIPYQVFSMQVKPKHSQSIHPPTLAVAVSEQGLQGSGN